MEMLHHNFYAVCLYRAYGVLNTLRILRTLDASLSLYIEHTHYLSTAYPTVQYRLLNHPQGISFTNVMAPVM